MSLFILCPKQSPKTQDSNFFHNCIFPPQVLTILHGIFVAPPTWWHSSLKNVCNLHPPDMIFSEPLRAAASRGSTSKKESGLALGAGFCEIQKLKKKYRVNKKNFLLIPAKTFGEGFLSRAPARMPDIGRQEKRNQPSPAI